MNRKKILVAEVELSIGRIYEREVDQPGDEAHSIGKPRSPTHHKLAVLLTSDSLNEDFTLWSADAHIRHGSRLENLKNAM